jgi:serine/threonine protein kinase
VRTRLAKRFEKPSGSAGQSSRLVTLHPFPKLVLKMLRNDLPDDRFDQGIQDTETEVGLLLKTSTEGKNDNGSGGGHPSVIHLYGVGYNPHGGRFMLLDELSGGTLTTRIEAWLEMKNAPPGSQPVSRRHSNEATANDANNTKSASSQTRLAGIMNKRSSLGEVVQGLLNRTMDMNAIQCSEMRHLWLERMVVMLQVASAICFLHEHGIIYRDLKADNVGFNADGMPKIFDFGLARTLEEDLKVKEEEDGGEGQAYNLTGATGSWLFMAPEVALKQPYGTNADVYSFAILMHEVLSLEPPFVHVQSVPQLFEHVVRGNERPTINSAWPASISNILQDSWYANRKYRPNSRKVLDRLEEVMRGPDGQLFPDDTMDNPSASSSSFVGFFSRRLSLAEEVSH